MEESDMYKEKNVGTNPDYQKFTKYWKMNTMK